jgi:uncharacterized RDD family membrane protein YckC
MTSDHGYRYANYGSRAVAYIIDFLILWGVAISAAVTGVAMLFAELSRPIGIILLVAAVIWLPAGAVWNYIIRQGSSGQTLGKSRVGIRLVRVDTGRPIGVGLAVIRVLAGWLFNSITGGLFLIVDLLFPAFDKRRQRVIDKMLNTVVIDATSPAATPASSSAAASLPPPPSDPFA